MNKKYREVRDEYNHQLDYVTGQLFRSLKDKTPDLSGYISDEDMIKLKKDVFLYLQFPLHRDFHIFHLCIISFF